MFHVAFKVQIAQQKQKSFVIAFCVKPLHKKPFAMKHSGALTSIRHIRELYLSSRYTATAVNYAITTGKVNETERVKVFTFLSFYVWV